MKEMATTLESEILVFRVTTFFSKHIFTINASMYLYVEKKCKNKHQVLEWSLIKSEKMSKWTFFVAGALTFCKEWEVINFKFVCLWEATSLQQDSSELILRNQRLLPVKRGRKEPHDKSELWETVTTMLPSGLKR